MAIAAFGKRDGVHAASSGAGPCGEAADAATLYRRQLAARMLSRLAHLCDAGGVAAPIELVAAPLAPPCAPATATASPQPPQVLATAVRRGVGVVVLPRSSEQPVVEACRAELQESTSAAAQGLARTYACMGDVAGSQ